MAVLGRPVRCETNTTFHAHEGDLIGEFYIDSNIFNRSNLSCLWQLSFLPQNDTSLISGLPNIPIEFEILEWSTNNMTDIQLAIGSQIFNNNSGEPFVVTSSTNTISMMIDQNTNDSFAWSIAFRYRGML